MVKTKQLSAKDAGYTLCFENVITENRKLDAPYTNKHRQDGQIDLLMGNVYSYQGIINSNYQMAEKEVIKFYNQRGNAANSNRYILNDFNLHHLPFPDIDTNTVNMYLMALWAVLFEWIKPFW